MAKNVVSNAIASVADALGLGGATPPADAQAPADASKQVEAFCLRDCNFGSAGQVVTLSAEDAKLGEDHGMLDTNPAAVAAAKKK